MRAFASSSGTRGCRLALGAILAVVLALGAGGCVREVTRASLVPKDEEAAKFRELPPEQFIYVGMDTERLKRLVGEPKRIEKPEEGGTMQVWHYDFGVVIVEGGSVKYKYPPSRAGRR